jgi:hypothetical protein
VWGEPENETELHTQIRKQAFDDLRFLIIEIAFRFLFEHAEHIDPVLGSLQVDSGFARHRDAAIMPKFAAAFEASDMIRLRKLAGSSSGSPPACAAVGSGRGAAALGLACGASAAAVAVERFGGVAARLFRRRFYHCFLNRGRLFCAFRFFLFLRRTVLVGCRPG